jgi:hypothetical protein
VKQISRKNESDNRGVVQYSNSIVQSISDGYLRIHREQILVSKIEAYSAGEGSPWLHAAIADFYRAQALGFKVVMFLGPSPTSGYSKGMGMGYNKDPITLWKCCLSLASIWPVFERFEEECWTSSSIIFIILTMEQSSHLILSMECSLLL